MMLSFFFFFVGSWGWVHMKTRGEIHVWTLQHGGLTPGRYELCSWHAVANMAGYSASTLAARLCLGVSDLVGLGIPRLYGWYLTGNPLWRTTILACFQAFLCLHPDHSIHTNLFKFAVFFSAKSWSMLWTTGPKIWQDLRENARCDV